MKKVLEQLKENRISLTKFCNDFGLSRNTALSYISYLEEGKVINKEKYNIIFRRLFLDEVDANFEDKYSILKNLYQRDKLNGTFEKDPEISDGITTIISKCNNVIENDEEWQQILFAVSCFLENYNQEPFKSMARYLFFFNKSTPEDYELLSQKEKETYLSYYRFLSMVKNGKRDSSVKEFEEMFLNRLREIQKFRDMK